MGAQDRTEKVLREMHVLFSKAEPYEGSSRNVIVDKNAMMALLKDLNDCMYDMMDEHELTVKSRDKANRQMQKQGDDIIFDATRKAEDIYAASIMYMDNTLANIQEIMDEADLQIAKIYEETQKKIKKEKREVKSNQMDLKSHLNDLIDTQKYLHLIEDENARLAKEKAQGGPVEDFDAPKYEAPEVFIDKEYFESNNIPFAADEVKTAGISSDEELSAEMSADLDAEYFKWQEEQNADSKAEEKRGFGLFGKKRQ